MSKKQVELALKKTSNREEANIFLFISNLAGRPTPEEPVTITEISTTLTQSFRIPRSVSAPEPPSKIQKIKRRPTKTIERRIDREIKTNKISHLISLDSPTLQNLQYFSEQPLKICRLYPATQI